MDNIILAEINRLSNRRLALYSELGHIIESGGFHLGSEQPQVIEAREIGGQLLKLWRERRAEGKFWMPRLREGKEGVGKYERPLQRRAHGYGATGLR